MDYIEAIKQRISRRSYLSTSIAPEKIAALKVKINECNTESGLNITLVEEKNYGMFGGAQAMILLKGEKNLPHIKEKVGYYGERLVLFATGMELGTCWVGGFFNKYTLFVPSGEELVCMVAVGNVREENSLKEKLIRGMVHRKSKTIEELLQTDKPITEKLYRAMELVRLAPTARNTQKVSITVKNGEITAGVPDDYQLDLVDLGICKLHFECGMGGRFEWGNGGKLIV